MTQQNTGQVTTTEAVLVDFDGPNRYEMLATMKNREGMYEKAIGKRVIGLDLDI